MNGLRTGRPLRPSMGFTLIELMVTLSVLALLAALAAPGFQQLTAGQRMRSASQDMIADLVLARSEALKRGVSVEVVPASAGWVGGWSVRVLQPASTTLSQRNAVGRGISVSSAASSISFDLNGRVDNDGSTVRLSLEEVGGNRKRCVSLDPSGRPRSSTTGCPA